MHEPGWHLKKTLENVTFYFKGYFLEGSLCKFSVWSDLRIKAATLCSQMHN